MNKARAASPLTLSGPERKHAIEELRHWFAHERGETVGELVADQLVDHLEKRVASIWYNRGIMDAQILVKDRLERLNDDVDLLRR